MSGQYILDGHTPVACNDVLTWGRWMENGAMRGVASDWIEDIHVSTVFLGLDHQYGRGPPMLFETMIFGGEHEGYCERCSTWEEAEEMHKVALAKVKP